MVRAGSISWFYEGTGGNFDYWPEGLDGPMLSERPPFGNVALIADNDRMYHRIGAIGDPNAELPLMSASAHIQPDGDGNWAILENGEIRATYPSHAIRLSVLWKAAVRDRESSTDNLTLDRTMAIFTADLRHRSVDFQMPSDHWPTPRGPFCCSRVMPTQQIPEGSNKAIQRACDSGMSRHQSQDSGRAAQGQFRPR